MSASEHQLCIEVRRNNIFKDAMKEAKKLKVRPNQQLKVVWIFLININLVFDF